MWGLLLSLTLCLCPLLWLLSLCGYLLQVALCWTHAVVHTCTLASPPGQAWTLTVAFQCGERKLVSVGVKFALMGRGSGLQDTEEAGNGLEQIWAPRNCFSVLYWSWRPPRGLFSFVLPEVGKGKASGHPRGPQEGASHPTSSLPACPCSHHLPSWFLGRPVSAFP